MNTANGRDVAETLADYQLPVLSAAVSQRVAFAESAAQGRTVVELAPQGIASQAITVLVDECITFMK